MTRNDKRSIACAVGLGVLLLLLAVPFPAAQTPHRPWHLRLDLGGGRYMTSVSAFPTRAGCEAALGVELLHFAEKALLVRAGWCEAEGLSA